MENKKQKTPARLRLVRGWFQPSKSAPESTCVFGMLSLTHRGKTAYWPTLELPWRANAQNVSCIPTGDYVLSRRVVGSFAERYRLKFGHAFVPEISLVPGRSEILFHVGNTAKHTKGCVLIGSGIDSRAEPVPGVRVPMLTGSVIGYRRFYGALARLDDAGAFPRVVEISCNLFPSIDYLHRGYPFAKPPQSYAAAKAKTEAAA